MDAVNDLFEKLSTTEFEEISCRLINSLIEKRVFHKFRFFDKYFYVGIDGTGIYKWNGKSPEDILKHALTKEYDSGKVSYFNLVLEAVLICKNGMKIPLMSEWIANDGEKYDKQDCELKAFKRLAVRLKKCFPRLNICILTDGLYSNVSMMDICSDYDWRFISVFKDGNLPSVWKEVESLLPLAGAAHSTKQELLDGNNWITRNYRWVKNIEYQKHNIHWIECRQETKNRNSNETTENRFVFLTNFDVDTQNIALILMAGRARWHIEDLFNTQKNRGGAWHHKFSRNSFNAIKIWHSVRQLSYMIIELAIHTSELQKLMKKHQKLTWKELWENIISYLTMLLIDSMMTEFEVWKSYARQVRLE
jgi:hypothetical protein